MIQSRTFLAMNPDRLSVRSANSNGCQNGNQSFAKIKCIKPNYCCIFLILSHCFCLITRSYDQMWSRYSGRNRTQDPWFSHSRPFLGCFMGTLSPSYRHKRSTRLSFTCQPASSSNAAIQRWPYRPTCASARSCERRGLLRQHAPLAIDAAWIGAGPERDKPVA